MATKLQTEDILEEFSKLNKKYNRSWEFEDLEHKPHYNKEESFQSKIGL